MNSKRDTKIMYKLFLASWPSRTNFLEIARELKRKGCEPVYWITKSFSTFPRNEFPGVIFHDIYSALKAYPAEGVDPTLLEPPGREVIEALYECESLTFSMMNRIDFSNTPFYRRRRLYYNMLSYWYGVFKKMKPDAVLFPYPPHAIYDFVLYSVAKYLDIKTVMVYEAMSMSQGIRRVFIHDDIKKEYPLLVEELARTQNIKLEDLSSDIKDYYVSRSRPEESFRYTEVTESVLSGRKKLHAFPLSELYDAFRHTKERGPIGGLARCFQIAFLEKRPMLTFDEPYTAFGYMKKVWEWRRKQKKFRKEYEALQVDVDWNKKFVFVPLHYQPELTTSPLGGIFVDQHLMLDILAQSIPENWVIYVKEHITQWTDRNQYSHNGRYGGYYNQIARLKNVFLIPINTPPPRLIEKCQALATVTGTGALEAVFKGKPALTFGYPRYKECTEIFGVLDVQSCSFAIAKIQNGYRPDQQRVLDYLGALDRVSIKSYIHKKTENISPDLIRESITKIADGIYLKITETNLMGSKQ